MLESAQGKKQGTRITSQTKKGEGKNNVRGAWKQDLLATCSSFLSHNLLSEHTKNGHAFPKAHGGQIKARHPPPDLVVWPGPCRAPWLLPTKRMMWAVPNLPWGRVSQHCSSSWPRCYELIQTTFACSRADCQQSSRRGNLWLEGFAKHLQAVMASTSTATCWLNICW